MHVDQPGRHQLAARVEHLLGPVGRNVRRHGGNLAVRDGDIQLAGQLLRRVDDAAALDQQVVGRRRLAGCRRRRGQVGAEAKRVEPSSGRATAAAPSVPRNARRVERDMSVLRARPRMRGRATYLANRHVRNLPRSRNSR